MRTLTTLVVMSAMTLSIHATAADGTFNAHAQIGLTSNSDLAIKELDVISSQSDTGTLLSAGLSAEFKATDALKFTPSYRYENTNYHTLDQYDLSLHQYGLDTNYKLAHTDIGFRYDGATAQVANKTFLTLDQGSLYIGHFVNNTTYLRAALKAGEKQFTTQPARDAQSLGLDTSLFYFINQGNTMLLLGASLDKEEATEQQYDFSGWTLNTRVSHTFTAFGNTNKASIGWRYQDKDYQENHNDMLTEPTPSRDESRHVLTAHWQLSLLDSLSLITEAEYGDYQSQLEVNTYTQSIASISLRAEF
ncbi:hypothetical protein [Pseudoalteromonas sp.]|uniref:hypothetical protein n=1 Tax=Pseudoalteromonas sp. TaxID=53249 RepID=UPI002729DAC3|nr:hypothetical protein [Pseudoalteromonas sp.]